MRSLRPALLAVTLAAVAVAGPAGSATAQQDPPKTDPSIKDGRAQKALDAARAKWAKAAVRTYRVRVAVSCFCPEEIRRPRTITVRRGVPIKPPEHLTDVATVPRMFRLIQQQIHDRIANLDVTYGARGVPKSIAIDVSQMIADEERYFTIDRFAAGTKQR